jgi:hypothetical protein
LAGNEEKMSNQRFSQDPSPPVRGAKKGDGARVSGAQEQQSGPVSTITSQVQDALDQQVAQGAKVVTKVAKSASRAADELENDAPQLAGLVRGIARRVEEYSHDLETRSVSDLYQAASDFTRRQPSFVFGLAALAGFLALRTLKSGPTSSVSWTGRSRPAGEEYHGA